jgi:hypothetical protein
MENLMASMARLRPYAVRQCQCGPNRGYGTDKACFLVRGRTGDAKRPSSAGYVRRILHAGIGNRHGICLVNAERRFALGAYAKTKEFD